MPKRKITSQLDPRYASRGSGRVHPELEMIPNGWSWTLDEKGNYLSVSPQVTDFLGFTSEHFLGQLLSSCQVKPEDDASIASLLESSQAFKFKTVMTAESGSDIPVEMDIRPEKDSGGSIMSWVGKTLVVTEGSSVHRSMDFDYVRLGGTSSLVDLGMDNFSIGLGMKEGEISPANRILTKAGRQSMTQKKTTIQESRGSTPTAIATPLQIRQQTSGVIEIIDERSDRIWKEDERLIVQEVAQQLGLALENAQLYQAAQKQLDERIKAESETLERNEQLAALNRAGQQLSKLASREDIFRQLYETAGDILDNRNLTIAISNENQTYLSFPVHSRNGIFEEKAETSFGKGVIEFSIHSNQAIFFAADVDKELTERNIDVPFPTPNSLLCVPIVTANRAIGAIYIESFDESTPFSQVSLELVSTLAFQASTALENANLFKEVNDALQIIEKRERYQASTASAVALLSEQGTAALQSVFEVLSQVTESDRIYFAKLMDDEQELYWKFQALWVKPGLDASLSGSELNHIPVGNFPNWAREFVEQGWAITDENNRQTPEFLFINRLDVNSIFLLSVSGKNAFPSFIAFEQLIPGRVWLSEEINTLQVVGDALANTIAREDLLAQLQNSLTETETLYESSHQLALANEYSTMISAVTTGINIPDINRGILVLFENDPEGNINRMSVAANWHSGNGTPPPPVGSEYLTSSYQPLFQRTSPLFIYDISEAPIDAMLQKVIKDQHVVSMAVLPLTTAQKQIGVLLLQSESHHRFTQQERRAYPPLLDQMTTAVENLRLYAQTQDSLAETELLYKMTNEISQAVDAQDLVRIIVQSVLPKSATRASLFTVVQSGEAEPTELELTGFYDLRGQFIRLGSRYSLLSLPILNQIFLEPLTIRDTATEESLDDLSRRSLSDLEMQSCVIVPLRSVGKLIGLLVISATSPAEYQPEEVRILRVVGNQISVTLEKQRLLREAQRRALELRTAAEIARDTVSTLSLETLLKRIVNQIYDRFGFYQVSLFLLDPTGEIAIIQEATGSAGEGFKSTGIQVQVGAKNLVGQVCATGDPIIINDISSSELYLPHPELPNTRSEIGIPLTIGERIIGSLDIHADTENAFTPDDVTVLRILADQIAVAIENARAFELSQKAVDELHELDRIKNQFLANMSHELRTPLNSIIGFSRVILKGIDGPINDTQAQDLSAIYNSGQHLLSLINNILDLSKIDSGKMELKLSEINIGDIINSAMTTATGLAKDKPIKFKQIVPPDLPKVLVDPTRIRQVLINFLSNACKFTDEGLITIEASSVTSPEGVPELLITVTDTGHGIDAKDRSKLFQPFSQVDDSPTRRAGGTGLGLSISRSLVDMHGGRIGLLSSEVGKGSTFFFTLPIPQLDKKRIVTGMLRESAFGKLQPEGEPSGQPVVETPEAKLKGLEETVPEKTATPEMDNVLPEPVIEQIPEINLQKIALVSSQTTLLPRVEKQISSLQYSTTIFTELDGLAENIKNFNPYAVVVDLNSTHLDAWDAIRKLRTSKLTKYLPLILTGVLERREKGLRVGSEDYLVIPLVEEEMEEVAAQLADSQRTSNLLLLDNNPESVRKFQTLVKDNKKIQLLTAKSGEEGLKLMTTLQPDRVIINPQLSDADIYKLLETMLTDFRLRYIQITILTGSDITEKQAAVLSEFNKIVFSKLNLEEVPFFKALQNSLRK
jgi:signal transduction histidine kinase/CheY-like chemotaxis protein